MILSQLYFISENSLISIIVVLDIVNMVLCYPTLMKSIKHLSNSVFKINLLYIYMILGF